MKRYSKVVIYTIVSMVVAGIAFFLLDSTGSMTSNGFTIGGGIVIYFANMYFLLKYDKQFDKPPHSAAIKESGCTENSIDSRDSYIARISKNIANSNETCFLVFRKLRNSSESNEAKTINDSIIERAKNDDNPCKIIILTANYAGSISAATALESSSSRVKVYFHDNLKISDLSLSISDKKNLVIGFSHNQSENYKQSSEWIESKSSTLNHLMNTYAKGLLNESNSLNEFIKSEVSDLKAQAMDDVHIRELLKIPEEVLSAVIGK